MHHAGAADDIFNRSSVILRRHLRQKTNNFLLSIFNPLSLFKRFDVQKSTQIERDILYRECMREAIRDYIRDNDIHPSDADITDYEYTAIYQPIDKPDIPSFTKS